jgi:4-hydroxy-tetrahydrodipicolinate synthase
LENVVDAEAQQNRILIGRDTGELRLPMCPLDATGEGKVKQTLINYGLL